MKILFPEDLIQSFPSTMEALLKRKKNHYPAFLDVSDRYKLHLVTCT